MALGLFLGAFAALAAARLLEGVLFEVGPSDPGVLISVVLLLAAAAVVAGAVPAYRAALADPREALGAV